MIQKSHFLINLGIFFLLAACASTPAPVQEAKTIASDSRTFGVLDMDALSHAKERIQEKDPLYLGAFEKLAGEARTALRLVPPSVLDKPFVPPSGNKHDYMSMGPYWWPNPETPDGLPYIRKDGVVNPERNQYDKIPGATMAEAVRALALMYYFTGDTSFSHKASELLKVWFINPETKMNPHLEFGQFIPGRSPGRSVGIIESRNFVFLTDYEQILRESLNWTEADHNLFKQWMSDFLQWLVTSEIGQKERAADNNHGSWCDYQVLALSQYCQTPESGQIVVDGLLIQRMAHQIKADGSQPEELERTKSFSYSVFNLDALSKIHRLTENMALNQASYETQLDYINRATLFLIPVVTDTSKWGYNQISSFNGPSEKLIYLLSFTASRTTNSNHIDELGILLNRFPNSIFVLTTPAVQLTQTLAH